MKNLITILLACFCSSCLYNRNYEEADRHVHLTKCQVNILEIRHGKHTIVNGYITYKGKDYNVTSNDGYYYKKYNLKPGDQIYLDVDIYFFVDKKDENNLYDDVTTIVIKPIDLKNYETPK